MIIGITGPTGAGKSHLCLYLKEKNIPCIDADGVYHSMLVPPSDCLDAIRAAFGDGVFTADGELDRAALGAQVFSSHEKLELLNRTVLDKVLQEIRRLIADYNHQGFDTVAVDAPTLIESGFHKECSYVISVLAPAEQRLGRIKVRDHLSEEKAELRLKAQKSDDFYIAASDRVLYNDGDTEKLRNSIEALISELGIV